MPGYIKLCRKKKMLQYFFILIEHVTLSMPTPSLALVIQSKLLLIEFLTKCFIAWEPDAKVLPLL